jgi:hypothetical protein
MAERTTWFPSAEATTMVVEAVREAATWSRHWRRSRTVRFLGVAVKARRTVWFPGVVTEWKSKSSDYDLRAG